jgi:hypothetical protein
MKHFVRHKITTVSGYLEVVISAIILMGIAIMSVQLIKDIVSIVCSISDSSMTLQFDNFMGDVL